VFNGNFRHLLFFKGLMIPFQINLSRVLYFRYLNYVHKISVCSPINVTIRLED